MMAEMTQTVLPGKFRVVPRVLCFLLDGDEVLLLKGAHDKKIWPGKLNGVGGHVEDGEDVLSAARREIWEETGLAVSDLDLRGIVSIQTPVVDTGILLFIFTATPAHRAAQASDEGTLQWVPVEHIENLDVVPDVPLLLERALPLCQGHLFFATYRYDADGGLQVTFAD